MWIYIETKKDWSQKVHIKDHLGMRLLADEQSDRFVFMIFLNQNTELIVCFKGIMGDKKSCFQ